MVDVSDLIGIPYKEHGRDKNGFDCYGAVLEYYKRKGIELPDFDYISHTDEMFTEKAVEVLKTKHFKKIPEFVEDAIVLMENSLGMKCHIGVYVGNGYIFHCNYKGVHLDLAERLSHKKGVYVWQK